MEIRHLRYVAAVATIPAEAIPVRPGGARAGSRVVATHRPPPFDPGVERTWRPLPAEVADVLCAQHEGRVSLHAHDEVEILLPLAPLRVADGRGTSAAAGSGSVAILNPGDLHALAPDGAVPCTARALLVGPGFLAEVWSELSGTDHAGPPPFPETVVDDPALAAELHAVFDTLRGPLAALESATRLRAALARLIVRHAALPREAPADAPRCVAGVARVRDHLRAHVDRSLSLDELAEVSGLSRFYLLRAFRARFGVSPHAYQAHLRLARARRLLAMGAAPSRAAYDAGFADQSHLTRRLKEATGLTPAAFARQLTGVRPPAGLPEPGPAHAATAA